MPMSQEFVAALAQFHREVLLPDIQRIVTESEGRLRDEMHGLFDGLAHRLERLETEYHMLVAGVRRIEERLDRVEQRLDGVEQRLDGVEQRLDKVDERLDRMEQRMALRTEVQDLKSRVAALESQIRELESRLDG